MDTVIVFCFVLVQLSQVNSQIFESHHGDHKSLLRTNLFQSPVAKSSYVDPDAFFRDSAIKKSFKNYAPNIDEPQINQKHNGRNLPNRRNELKTLINHGIANNNEDFKFLSQLQQSHENTDVHKLLKNEQGDPKKIYNIKAEENVTKDDFISNKKSNRLEYSYDLEEEEEEEEFWRNEDAYIDDDTTDPGELIHLTSQDEPAIKPNEENHTSNLSYSNHLRKMIK
ncbi:uncharacterized protein LOC119190463 [Manduca sexta]|uniref:uncharacterized protein LOC119190463 n=1 Tax=Manduca sexta TaxID=7130 RepID=UPI00188F3ED0|nr:uncharacterized protein LOC119190463 [Manduca sexta]